MSEENKTNKSASLVKKVASNPKTAQPISKAVNSFSRDKKARKPRRFRKPNNKPDDGFEQKIIDLARVTRVMAGGKRMRFRACIAIGDSKGRVAIGVAKGADVTIAISKSVLKAKKEIIKVPIVNGTIPYEVRKKFKAAKIMLKPASKGTGVKAGGAVRIVLELAGVPNVVGKILGSNNKINNVKAAIEALKELNEVKRANKGEKKKVEKVKDKVKKKDK